MDFSLDSSLCFLLAIGYFCLIQSFFSGWFDLSSFNLLIIRFARFLCAIVNYYLRQSYKYSNNVHTDTVKRFVKPVDILGRITLRTSTIDAQREYYLSSVGFHSGNFLRVSSKAVESFSVMWVFHSFSRSLQSIIIFWTSQSTSRDTSQPWASQMDWSVEFILLSKRLSFS